MTDPQHGYQVIVFGLNPAYQATLYFERFHPGKVNRANRKTNSIGGKGQNFAIACSEYGSKGEICLVHPLGGTTGAEVQKSIQELGIPQRIVPVAQATRTCTTILDAHTGDMTELIEPSGTISSAERKELESVVLEMFGSASQSLRGIALCGSLPPGLDGETYTFICEHRPKEAVVLLDAVSNVECLWRGLVDILKINAEEAYILAGRPETKATLDLGSMLLGLFSVRAVAITDGPSKAYLFVRDPGAADAVRGYAYSIPNVQALVHASGQTQAEKPEDVPINPLGAGDTCSAVFLLEFLRTKDYVQSFRRGLAAASASCLILEQTARFEKRWMDVCYENTDIEPL
ncbi:Ribokinase-like protein [Polychytrium aggregatum]|uniref:Ribokinase-like protein n=1 Tax=Polychytrium aggregatum TaxID=110093 RepID=UPI0022FDE5B8|nr:Ribokinase-like protein [Polychytrium aggregatum]KAI9197435.1 Ribokinase-like protein [Polychytrium aggregatum]